ncbi:hypothetical protein HPB50_000744 [Hyalomma asiaticum]|uniref:Uncharacterized protein n=1 Tax=Hyalomma asiaticum TaxID=266040 RepID=A0ACB7SJA0_HYAAI|nr:hypothetical protein HPB50_000744 [Hyalomma asiaticum]
MPRRSSPAAAACLWGPRPFACRRLAARELRMCSGQNRFSQAAGAFLREDPFRGPGHLLQEGLMKRRGALSTGCSRPPPPPNEVVASSRIRN